MSERQEGGAGGYRVLARKYRPARFADLIGQDVLVRTLANAFAANRLAHAWLLTGVRGVGKTTTARIVARALNCIGADGAATAPSAEPCGVCEHCRAIAGDRHVDVLEMDAASRTGVDDVREIVESVRYAPASGRYKVYIVDEVHMLSTAAFNALLKTLEEPPPHVKFVFATTEARKIPVTVLSRCQRFDLRRVEAARLAEHLASVAEREGAEAGAEALALIARAADGSVRDALSLLDQAIGDAAGKPVAAAAVRDMLGLADRERVFDLLERTLDGGLAAALDLLEAQDAAGADPATVLEDMLGLAHWLTRLKLTPEAAADPGLPEAERVRARALAEKLAVAELTRAWQILLKGLAETREAPAPLQAAEMVLIRLAHAAALPPPAELVRRLEGAATVRGGAGAGAGAGAARAALGAEARAAAPAPPPAPSAAPPVAASPVAAPPAGRANGAGAPPAASKGAAGRDGAAGPRSFAAAAALFAERREPLLHRHLTRDAHLVEFAPGHIALRAGAGAPPDLAARVKRCLDMWTGGPWTVLLSPDEGAPTLDEQARARAAELSAAAAREPLVARILETFPGAEIRSVRPGAGADAAAHNTKRGAGEP